MQDTKNVKMSEIVRFYTALFNGKAKLGEKMNGEYSEPVSIHMMIIRELRESGQVFTPDEQRKYISKFIKEFKKWGWTVVKD